LRAYVAAAQVMAARDPQCKIPWSLLAGIGRVETNHGRFGGAVITASGRVSPPIYGPLLNGNGFPLIRDTDGGRLDGNAQFDRAVGPMQFIPGTWAMYGADGNGDGVADPQNVDDAALAAARYLCAGGGDLSTQTGRWNAVYRYNHSASYVSLVLGLADSYATGTPTALPSQPAGVKAPVGPPASVGTPSAVVLPAAGSGTSTSPAAAGSPAVSGTGTNPGSPEQTPSPGTGTTAPAEITSTSPGTTTPTPTDTGTATPTPSDTTSPAGTATPAPSGTTSPAGTTTPAPTATPAPSGTTSPAGTTTPTPADTGTATPTPSVVSSATPTA
jgi:Transglycosylase SLT domain